jgi:hypothetical protein
MGIPRSSSARIRDTRSSARVSNMVFTRLWLLEMRSAVNGASGRFFQYFFGISDCIASTFSRAGLKMLR